MWTGLSAPLLSGILGGIVYLANRRQLVPTWIAVVLIALSETLISCYTLILVTKPSEFFTVVTTVAIPIVVFNVIGMFIFTSVVYHTLDEKKAQKEMQILELEVESKRNLATIINTIAYPVYVLDRNHRFVVVNDSLCRFIGRPEEDILTRTPRDFFRESDATFHWDMTEDVFQSRITREDEVTITKPDGQICTLISTSALYRDASSQVFMVGVIQDITQRKQVEEALFQKNEELDRYFTHTLDLLCIADMNGYFRRLNNEWESALGYSPAEMEGKRIIDFVHPDDREATLGTLSELRAGKKVLQFMNRYLHRDGSFRWIEWHIFPAGNVFYAVARDVTDQKMMMEQIQASLAEKETLLKEVHHRVKNNLQIIASLLNMQIRKIHDPTTVDALKDCQNQVRSMSLVHEHLYRSKDFSQIDLENYIRSLGTTLLSLYEPGNRGVRFDISIHEIYVDTNTAIPLGLISNELITNSLKHAFKGRDGGRLSVTAAEDQHFLSFVVADNRAGIRPDITLENQTTLGLKLVNMLTEQLNGTVVIDRTGGTMFTFTFPKGSEKR